jgi:hypothetical protein
VIKKPCLRVIFLTQRRRAAEMQIRSECMSRKDQPLRKPGFSIQKAQCFHVAKARNALSFHARVELKHSVLLAGNNKDQKPCLRVIFLNAPESFREPQRTQSPFFPCPRGKKAQCLINKCPLLKPALVLFIFTAYQPVHRKKLFIYAPIR